MSEAILKVNNLSYRGWTSLTVQKSLNQMTGTFGMSTTNKFPGDPKKWNISMGSECIVEIDGQKIITGYIDAITESYDSNNHNIAFEGRDRTGDLIDCCFDDTNKEFKGLSLKSVIEKLCEPFNISIVVDSSVTSAANTIWPDNIKASEGDTVFDIIVKVCSMKAILPVSYGDGKLTLTRAGLGYKASDALVSGKNILSGNFNQSDRDRYSTYIVKGQGIGNDNKTELFTVSSPASRVSDTVILRYRPTIIFTETPCNEGQCIDRAKWEKNKRAGTSRQGQFNVQGWTQSDGKVWPLNSLVQIKDDKLAINETLLISNLNFKIDEGQGSITEMTVVHPYAFTVLEKQIKAGFDLGF